MKNRIRVYVVPDLFRLSRHYFPAVSYDGRLSLVQHNILHQTGDIAVELIHSGTINFRLQVHFKQLTVFVFQVFAFHFLTTRASRQTLTVVRVVPNGTPIRHLFRTARTVESVVHPRIADRMITGNNVEGVVDAVIFAGYFDNHTASIVLDDHAVAPREMYRAPKFAVVDRAPAFAVVADGSYSSWPRCRFEAHDGILLQG
jgi:hypothetical protein